MNGGQDRTQCVYTIVNRDRIIQALDNGGEGEFEEGKSWAAAAKHLATLELAEPYPLLLGDAATTAGVVEWVAMIESIELIEGGGTRVQFSALAELTDTVPLNALLKVSDSLPVSLNYIRPYVPCTISGETEEYVLWALTSSSGGDHEVSFRVVGEKTAADFVDALRAVEGSMSAKQRAMLIGHATFPGHRLSMRSLAEIGGYARFQSANIQYGKLGRKFADFFAVPGLANQTQAIAWSDGKNDAFGHFTWVLREPLVEALQSLGWIPRPIPLDFGTIVAAAEIDSDPKCIGVSATVRQALIDARVGQGGYRNRLLELWGSKCALTGCALKQILIASHSKSWAASTNEERVDEYNGLLLAAHVDRLFDAGLISFFDDGRMQRKNEVDDEVLKALGISEDAQLRLVDPRHIPYLKVHRDHHGFSS